MANNSVNVSLAFTADTKQAKQAIDNLHKQLDNLLNANVNFNLSERFTAEVKESQAAIAQLQVALNGAFNADTGRLDLSKFQESMQKSGMSLKKYQKILSDLGPAGDKAFSQLALSIVNSEIPLKRSNKLLTDMWTTMKNTARWQLSASVLQGFQGALQKAYGYAQDLNESLNNIRIVTSASVDDMAKFATEANKAAKALSTTTTEYTNASLIYYQQGLSAQEVKERTDVTIKMANVSRESAETVSDQMTAVWNNFDDGSKSLEYYADVMTALGAATASSTAEITTGLEKFAAVAETVGLSYEYATTALATITDTTRQSADVVGNALKTLFARIQGLSLGETLEDGTDLNKYSEALMKVGISIKEQDGSLKKMDTILDEMANKWGTLAKDQQVALAQTVAGVRQYTQLVALMDNWDKFQKNLSVANNATGALQEQADIYAESWEAARKRVTAAAEEIYSSLLNDEFFIDLTDGFAKMLGHINNLLKTLGGLPGVLAIVGTAFNKIFSKQLISGINNMTYSIRMLNPKNQQNVRDEKINAARALEQQAADKFGGNSAIAADLYRAQGNSIERYLEIEEKITEEDRKQVEYLMTKQNADTQRAIQLAEQADLIESETDEMYEQIEIAAKAAVTKGYGQKRDLTTFIKSNNTARAMAKVQAQFTVEPVLDNKNLQRTKDRIKRALETVDTSSFTAKGKKAFAELSQVANDGTADVEEVSAAMKKFSEIMQQESGKARSALSKLDGETEDLVASFDAAEDKTVSLKGKIREMSQAAEGASVSTATLDGAVDKLSQGKPLDLGTKINYIADALGNAAMLATSFKGIIDTWKDDDIPLIDKILSSLTTLSIVFPMVISSFDKFYKLLLNDSMADLGKDIANAGGAMNFLKGGAGGATQALKKLGKSLLSVLPVLLAIGAAIGIIYFIWKQIKENSPEGQLEKATKVTEDLAQALNDAKTAAEELKNAIEGYESAEQALEDCVEGTKEYEEALRKANEAALELLRNNPELYSSGGVTRENGRIKISEEAYNGLQEKYINRQAILNGAYANSQQTTREKGIAKEWDDINKILDKADYKYSDESDAIRKLFTHQYNSSGGLTVEDLYQYRSANNPHYSELLNDPEIFSALEQAIIELSSAVDENTVATQIESEQAVDELLDKDYSDAVIKSLGKTYNDKVNSEKAKFTWKDSNAELFEEYKTLMGLSGAVYSASENTYTINGETYNLTRDAMIEALAVNNAKNGIQTDADKLTKLLGNENTLQSRLVNEGASSLSKAEMAKIDSSMLSEMVSLGAITQAVANEINSINPDDIDLNSLEDTLSADLQQTLNEVFGENWSQEEIGDLIGKIPADLRDEFAQAVSQTNWSDVDSAQGFHDLLTELGGWMPEDEVEGFVQQMMDANNAVKNIELDTFKSELFDIKGLIGELEKGDTIKAEDWAQLTDAEKEYFTLTSDGTYMLTEDAKKFYDVVMNGRIDEAKEKIEELQKATQSGRSGYADYLRYTKDGNELTGEQARDILTKGNVDYDADASDEDLIAKANAFAETYKKNTTDLKNWQEAVAASAEEQSELKKMLDEGTISWSVYAKAMTAMKTAQEKAMKSLRSNIAGVSKSAPELEELITLLQDGADVTSVKFIESVEEAINKFPELTGSIMTAYDALQTALPGTQEYTDAWTDFYNILQTNATAQVLEDNANTANEALKILTDEDSSLNELNNAAAQLYNLFGWEIDTSNLEASADKFDMLKKALDGDVTAFERLQRSIAEGILLKFHATSSVDFEALWNGLIETGTLAKEVEQALIDSGAFEVVETTIDTPVVKKDLAPEEQLWLEKLGMDDKGDGFYLNEVSAAAKTAMQAMSIEWKPRKVRLLKPVNSTHAGDFSPSGTDDKDTTPKAATPGTKKKYEDEIDPFYKHKKKLDNLNDLLEEYQHNKEMAFSSKEASDWMDAEIEALKEVRSEYTNYINSVDTKLDGATQLLEQQYGAIIDAQTGTITNYEQIYQKAIDEYNKGIVSTDEEMQKKAEEDFEKFIKALENYEELYRLLIDLMADRRETEAEILQAQLDQIDYMVNKGLAVEDDDLELLEYMINKISDAAFSAADAIAELSKETTNYIAKSDIYRQGLQDLQDLADAQGGWTDEMIEQMREYKTGLLETNEALMELQDTIEEKVNLALDECTQELDKHISRFDIYTQLLQNYNDIIDLSGKKYKDYTLLLELSNKQVDVSIDKLASTKEKLDMLKQSEVDAQTQLANVTAAGAPADVIKYWEDTLEDIQIRIEEANEEMTSTWVEALQAASDAYDNSVQIAIEKMQSALSVFNNLDEMESAYDRAEEISERYLDDFEKVYELNKLSKNIAKDINEISSQYGKNKMAELLEEINELESSNAQISQFELEILQKKYDLKVAEIALEEAQNAKSQVKLTRDNEGNWSYQYTADQESIDEAQQRYDDALYDIEQTSRDYIDEMSGLIIQNQKEMVEALGSIRAADYATEQDYYKALDEVREYYIERDAYLRTELQKGLDNTGTYYAADQVKYAETTLAKLENANSWQEAQANLTNQTNTLVNEMMGAYQNWQMKVEEAMVAAGTSSTEFLGTMQGNMSQVDTASENLRKALEEDASTMAGYISSVMQAVGNWQIQYAAKIAQIIEENEKLVASFNAIARAQHYSTATRATAVDYSQRITDYIFNQGGSVKDQAVLDDLYDRSGVYDSFTDEKKSTILNNDQLMDVINKGVEIKGKDESKRTQDEKELLQFVENIADKTNGNKYYTLKDLDPFKNVLDVDWLQFDTGGYTGNWGPSGRLAMVHEKELILNPEDTENFLAGINALRQIAQVIDLSAFSMGLGQGFNLPSIGANGSTLEQDVRIEAIFPSVTSRTEIEEAFTTLINTATQYANRK